MPARVIKEPRRHFSIARRGRYFWRMREIFLDFLSSFLTGIAAGLMDCECLPNRLNSKRVGCVSDLKDCRHRYSQLVCVRADVIDDVRDTQLQLVRDRWYPVVPFHPHDASLRTQVQRSQFRGKDGQPVVLDVQFPQSIQKSQLFGQNDQIVVPEDQLRNATSQASNLMAVLSQELTTCRFLS